MFQEVISWKKIPSLETWTLAWRTTVLLQHVYHLDAMNAEAMFFVLFYHNKNDLFVSTQPLAQHL